jgi:hypothetical protein
MRLPRKSLTCEATIPHRLLRPVTTNVCWRGAPPIRFSIPDGVHDLFVRCTRVWFARARPMLQSCVIVVAGTTYRSIPMLLRRRAFAPTESPATHVTRPRARLAPAQTCNTEHSCGDRHAGLSHAYRAVQQTSSRCRRWPAYTRRILPDNELAAVGAEEAAVVQTEVIGDQPGPTRRRTLHSQIIGGPNGLIHAERYQVCQTRLLDGSLLNHLPRAGL